MTDDFRSVMNNDAPIRIVHGIWIGIWVLLFLSTRVDADTGNRPSLIMLSTGDSTNPSGFDVVKAHLVDLPVSLTLETRAPAAGSGPIDWGGWADQIAARLDADIVFWVDPEAPDRLWMMVREATGPTLSSRRIDAAGDLPNRFESMATIVRAEARTLLESRRPPRVETPAVSDNQPALPSPSLPRAPGIPLAHAQIGIDLSYGLSLQSTDALVAHGIRAGICGYITDRFRLVAGYRIQLPTRIDHPLLVLEITSHPLEIGGSVQWSRGSNRLHTGLVAVVDWMSWRVDPKAAFVTPSRDHLSFRWALSPSIGYSRRLTGRFYLLITASLDVFVYQRSLTVNGDDTTEVLFEPWTASPYFQMGLLLEI